LYVFAASAVLKDVVVIEGFQPPQLLVTLVFLAVVGSAGFIVGVLVSWFYRWMYAPPHLELLIVLAVGAVVQFGLFVLLAVIGILVGG
jgi:hypothetical protein